MEPLAAELFMNSQSSNKKLHGFVLNEVWVVDCELGLTCHCKESRTLGSVIYEARVCNVDHSTRPEAYNPSEGRFVGLEEGVLDEHGPSDCSDDAVWQAEEAPHCEMVELEPPLIVGLE